MDAVDFPGCACKCFYNFLLSCKGVDANCKDPESDACKNPDKSKASCEQGGGNCGGYAPIYPLVMENKIIDIRNYSNASVLH